MSLALVSSRALTGLHAPAVTVEVHLANGLPSFTLVGLADTEVKEARERVRSAIQNTGLEFPLNKRITVNLAPADLPKDSGRFDLPIALGILAADGQIDGSRLAGYVFAGELSLSGQLRPVRGALAMAAALPAVPDGAPGADGVSGADGVLGANGVSGADGSGTDGSPALVLPPGSAEEAALVPSARVYRAVHLLDVVRQFLPAGSALSGAHSGDLSGQCAGESGNSSQYPPAGWQRLDAPQALPAPQYPDLADVRGQAQARRALEICAAGGHSLLMLGPPGSGKSMLAQRFAGLLPPMTTDEALQAAAVASAAGRFQVADFGRRRVQSPHHSASAVALVGGGSPPRPGEISLATHGVLFLDELPEFPRQALEALREPLENGQIHISRAAHQVTFPAQFQLIAAMNPCPCGYLGSQVRTCRCTPDQVQRYQNRISGPLLDRIDLHIEVPALPPAELLQAPAGDSSQTVRERVQTARARAMQRQGCMNASLQGQALHNMLRLPDAASQFVQHAASKLGWSARAMHRILRVARTIADLAGSDAVEVAHVAEAMQMRRALLQR